jgi:L-rhamnonate dehydratase
MAITVRKFPVIEVRTFLVKTVGSGGDYHNVSPLFYWIISYHIDALGQVKGGHWLIDSPIATPMSGWEQYRK